jgi:AcrR family transcriptional regulator
MSTPAKSIAPLAKSGKRVEQLEHRCLKFVEAAEQLFLERGFDGTSVNEVVRLAGGSLATLYANYGSKEELFEAVMNRRAAALFTDIFSPASPAASNVSNATKAAAGSKHAKMAIRDELLRLARTMQSHMLHPNSLAVFRLAVHEGPKYASVRDAVLNNGLGVFLRNLAAHLKLVASDQLDMPDAAMAAEDFLTLVQGQQRFIAACGGTDVSGRATQEAHAVRAVDAFLRLYPPLSLKPASEG